jgi:hypothetical protein
VCLSDDHLAGMYRAFCACDRLACDVARGYLRAHPGIDTIMVRRGMAFMRVLKRRPKMDHEFAPAQAFH